MTEQADGGAESPDPTAEQQRGPARAPASRRVASIRDVAAGAGVSVGTVSNVLNAPERVAPATAERVQAVIEELGYVRNEAARQLRAGTSLSLGFVVLDVGNPFFTDVARGAQEVSSSAGLSVVLGTSDQDPAKEAAYLDLFEQQRVAGVLLTPVETDAAMVARVARRTVPVVLVDHRGDDPRVSSVAVDDVAGGAMAVQHLLDLGHRRIAMVGTPSVHVVAARLEGARQAVAGQPGATLELVDTDSFTVPAGRTAGRTLLRRPRAERPEAVFAANDMLAVGCQQAFAVHGPDAGEPHRIALIGYDDVELASVTSVPLSSVRQPREEIGRTAVRLLLEQIADPDAPRQHPVFTPELVVRESTTSGVPVWG
ncbi:LacI family DNA-binding transcriptional regulator [Desertihabitans aurantiacus]|uniref:LacI family DNA-binding transcriptional regulator n=1 Tax=Desertihabitans aurantiacus TaxID=2282477 RepID=UPI000DF85440|nr:LacI family DNA-binding transcriptional regulator [Desertihabitans aurantiacus]